MTPLLRSKFRRVVEGCRRDAPERADGVAYLVIIGAEDDPAGAHCRHQTIE
jgi:hypothetical protein